MKATDAAKAYRRPLTVGLNLDQTTLETLLAMEVIIRRSHGGLVAWRPGSLGTDDQDQREAVIASLPA
ncbi:hypothetical protein SLNSH_06700 [Alsobacter soli]|uniref:Uncharacterized protein n=1 Tax=Alsobacter soli TaxID=2109933 RepID=A0A2T1HVJ2_9HYPH|nr:hypothetical protein SLNSH_06700 [Alsobacter soli]